MRRLGRVCWRGGREGEKWWLKVGYEVSGGFLTFTGDDANSYLNICIVLLPSTTYSTYAVQLYPLC